MEAEAASTADLAAGAASMVEAAFAVDLAAEDSAEGMVAFAEASGDMAEGMVEAMGGAGADGATPSSASALDSRGAIGPDHITVTIAIPTIRTAAMTIRMALTRVTRIITAPILTVRLLTTTRTPSGPLPTVRTPTAHIPPDPLPTVRI